MVNIIETAKNELTFENILMKAMHTPGVKVNRIKFLQKEFIKYYPKEVIDEAIKNNPAKAGVSKAVVNKISQQVINYETTKVTGISFLSSLPGGAVAIGAAAADFTSYFAFILRTVQELAYLYGFEQFDLNEDEMDSETMNFLLLFIGVMFGVQGAFSVLKKFEDTLAKNIAKKLAQKALTKGTIYPLVKKVALKVGIRMTKQIFADSVASTIPVAGSVLSGGLTFATFKPCCMKLRKNLMSYNLCDPDYYKVIDVEFYTTGEE